MKYRPVNLASKPFVNARPVVRATMMLWGIGAILMLLNGVLYGRSLVGMEDRKERLAATEAEIAIQEASLSTAREAVIALDLVDQNDEAAYLQARFEERRFPWSRLFSQLAGVLPRDVRLFRVKPEGFERGGGRGVRRGRDGDAGGKAAPRQTWLRIAGAAKSDQALVDLLDALFADPAFGAPQLPGESRDADGSIRFSLSTNYFPDAEPTDSEPSSATDPQSTAPAAAGSDAMESGVKVRAVDALASSPPGSTGIGAPGSASGAERVSSGRPSAPNRGAAARPGNQPRGNQPRRGRPGAADGSGDPTETADGRDDLDATPRPLARNASTPGVPN